MLKFLGNAILVTSLLFSTTSFAQAPIKFWLEKKLQTEDMNWIIYGNMPTVTHNATCNAETAWPDGTVLWLIKDLHDQEVYVQIKNPDWNILSAEGTKGSLLIEFGSRGFDVISHPYEFIVSSGARVPGALPSIHLRGLQKTDFIENFMKYKAMRFRYSNAHTDKGELLYVGLSESNTLIKMLTKCMDGWDSMGKKRNKR